MLFPVVPNPFIFLPFNGGPRICLGQQVRSPRFSSPTGTSPDVIRHSSSHIRRRLSSSSACCKRSPRYRWPLTHSHLIRASPTIGKRTIPPAGSAGRRCAQRAVWQCLSWCVFSSPQMRWTPHTDLLAGWIVGDDGGIISSHAC